MIEFYGDATDNYELSNFYPHPFQTKKKFPKISIMYKGQSWPTSEHLYQALKFKYETTEEKEWREIIRNANTPYIAKYLGHQDTYVRYKWNEKYRNIVLAYKDKIRLKNNIHDLEFRKSIMLKALRAKFSLPSLREYLLSTGNEVLREKSNDVWSEELGVLLMKVREENRNN